MDQYSCTARSLLNRILRQVLLKHLFVFKLLPKILDFGLKI